MRREGPTPYPHQASAKALQDVEQRAKVCNREEARGTHPILKPTPLLLLAGLQLCVQGGGILVIQLPLDRALILPEL